MAYRPATIRGSAVGGFTAGSVPFAAADGTLTGDNPSFTWDATNNQLILTAAAIITRSTDARLNLGVGTGRKLYIFDNLGTQSGFGVDLSGGVRELSLFHPTTGTTGRFSFGRSDTVTQAFTEYASLSPTALTISALNIVTDTTTGTKIGTATTQKLSVYNATPIVQGAAVADAAGGINVDIEARAAINALLARIRAFGVIAP